MNNIDETEEPIKDDLAIPSEFLDEIVLDEASSMAAGINNDGKGAQLEFLYSRGWTDESIRDRLKI